MLCPLPKLTPLQSRLLASVLTLGLLGVIYWTLSHPHFAYAAELEHDGAGRLRSGEDHNWHRIAGAQAEGGLEYVEADQDGTTTLSARAPAVSITAGNNVPNVDNIEPGTTTVWEFTSEQLNGPRGERGVGMPRDVDTIEDEATQHVELRRRSVDGSEDSGLELVARQTGSSKLIYISINTCLQPGFVGTGVQSAAPPQLTLYVSTQSSNRQPGPGSTGQQRSITLNEGFASSTIEADGNWYMSVHAPSLPSNFSGVWNYELAVSIDDYYHSVNDSTSNLFLIDSDSEAALLVTNNLTQASPSSPSYKQWMQLAAPYVVFATNANDTVTMGLSNSFCGLNKNSQIRGNQDEVEGNSTNVQMQMITRGLGNKPKEQFYVTALNRSSSYYATLARVGNSTASGAGVIGGGGKVWSPMSFQTKTDGNCALLFNLSFCSEVAYAVPSNPDIVSNYTHFQSIYDDYVLGYYQNFNYSIQQVPCQTDPDAQYSLARNCDDCKSAYKDWLCAVSIPRCEDFSSDSKYFRQPRNVGQRFLNGTRLPASYLDQSYIPMYDAPTLEGTVAFKQTYGSSVATNRSRNPIIDSKIAPGPYKEVLPCDDLCYGLMQSCPAALGFGCPYPGRGLEAGYGNRDGNGNGSLSCSFLGAYVYTGGSSPLMEKLWLSIGIAGIAAASISFL